MSSKRAIRRDQTEESKKLKIARNRKKKTIRINQINFKMDDDE